MKKEREGEKEYFELIPSPKVMERKVNSSLNWKMDMTRKKKFAKRAGGGFRN